MGEAPKKMRDSSRASSRRPLPGRERREVSLEWTLRLVKSGSYTVDMLFNKSNDSAPPAVSSRISLLVEAKINLNPDNVLPVTFGVPIFLIVVSSVINYRRRSRLGI